MGLMARTFNYRQVASQMVLGFPKNRYRGFNTFSDARIWLESVGNDTFHFFLGLSDGDKTESDEHKGIPARYVANNGQHAAIFENYRYCNIEVC